MVVRSRIMQPAPDKMDVISVEAHAGCWGTALPPENRVTEWSSAGGKELMIWRCGKTENFQRTGPADWRGECGGNKWVSDFQLRLCHHLQGEPILCLLWKHHADARFTFAAWMRETTEAKPIHTSTCHVDLSSTPGVCASPWSLDVPLDLGNAHTTSCFCPYLKAHAPLQMFGRGDFCFVFFFPWQ